MLPSASESKWWYTQKWGRMRSGVCGGGDNNNSLLHRMVSIALCEKFEQSNFIIAHL
jgi:hypothetical protein